MIIVVGLESISAFLEKIEFNYSSILLSTSLILNYQVYCLWVNIHLFEKLLHFLRWTEIFLYFSSSDVHEDVDYRGCNRGMLLQGTKHSHKDAYDGLSSLESGLSKQENKLRYVNLLYQASIIFIFNLSDIQLYAVNLSKCVSGSFINLYKAIKKTPFYLYGRTEYNIFIFYWKCEE